MPDRPTHLCEGASWCRQGRGQRGGDEVTQRCAPSSAGWRGRRTYVGKLGYDIFTLVVTVKAVPRAEVLGGSHDGLLVVGVLGAAVDASGAMLALGPQQQRLDGSAGWLGALAKAICRDGREVSLVVAGGAGWSHMIACGTAPGGRVAVLCARRHGQVCFGVATWAGEGEGDACAGRGPDRGGHGVRSGGA